jgi:hypothetical protein
VRVTFFTAKVAASAPATPCAKTEILRKGDYFFQADGIDPLPEVPFRKWHPNQDAAWMENAHSIAALS